MMETSRATTSAVPPTADIVGHRGHVRKVPSAVEDLGRNSRSACAAPRRLCPNCRDRTCYRRNMASAYCALRTVFPKVISGLRRPIAIQAAINFNMNLPE